MICFWIIFSSIFISFKIFVILLLAFPLYEDVLKSQLRARSYIYEDTSFEREYRYRVTFIVIDETFSNLKSTLIGKEAFNSPGNYNKGRWEGRPLHIDYNILLHGTGIFGLILYILILVNVLIKYFTYARYLPDDLYFHKLNSMFKILFMLLIIVSINGGIFQLSYRAIIFLYMGSLMGIFNKYYKYRDMEA